MPEARPALLNSCGSNHRNISWEDLEKEVISFFDTSVPIVDYWGVPIGKQHVAQYCSAHMARFRYITDVVRRLVPSGGRVLEVGTAYGVVLMALRGMGYEVEGTDMAEGIESYGIPLVRSGISVSAWDLHKQPCPCERGSFDVVIASEVLEHLQISLRTAVGKLAALLRPDGWLVVTTPNVYRLQSVKAMIKDLNLCEEFPDEAALKEGVVVDGRCHPREPTMRELREAFQQNALCEIDSTYFNYILKSRRGRLIYALFPRLREACLILGRIGH